MVKRYSRLDSALRLLVLVEENSQKSQIARKCYIPITIIDVDQGST